MLLTKYPGKWHDDKRVVVSIIIQNPESKQTLTLHFFGTLISLYLSSQLLRLGPLVFGGWI